MDYESTNLNGALNAQLEMSSGDDDSSGYEYEAADGGSSPSDDDGDSDGGDPIGEALALVDRVKDSYDSTMSLVDADDDATEAQLIHMYINKALDLCNLRGMQGNELLRVPGSQDDSSVRTLREQHAKAVQQPTDMMLDLLQKHDYLTREQLDHSLKLLDSWAGYAHECGKVLHHLQMMHIYRTGQADLVSQLAREKLILSISSNFYSRDHIVLVKDTIWALHHILNKFAGFNLRYKDRCLFGRHLIKDYSECETCLSDFSECTCDDGYTNSRRVWSKTWRKINELPHILESLKLLKPGMPDPLQRATSRNISPRIRNVIGSHFTPANEKDINGCFVRDKNALDTFETCIGIWNDPRLPRLMLHANCFSFRNGVLNPSGQPFNSRTDEDTGHVIGMGRAVFSPLDDDETSECAKHFSSWFRDADIDFTTGKLLDHEGTPNFDALLRFQGMSAAVIKWFKIMIGRAIMTMDPSFVNDKWELAVLLYGLGGTGKSTILDIIRMIFPNHEVATMSAGNQKEFWGACLVDANGYTKRILILPEWSDKINFPEAEFKRFVTGENVQVCKKNKEDFLLAPELLPIFIASNKPPTWSNEEGQIDRRMFIFKFMEPVTIIDTSLKEKIENEMGALIHLCTQLYNYERIKIGARTPLKSDRIPAYFRENLEILQRTNVLHSFLKDPIVYKSEYEFIDASTRTNKLPRLKFGPRRYMPLECFFRTFKFWGKNQDSDIKKKCAQLKIQDKATLKTNFSKFGVVETKCRVMIWPCSSSNISGDDAVLETQKDFWIKGIGFQTSSIVPLEDGVEADWDWCKFYQSRGSLAADADDDDDEQKDVDDSDMRMVDDWNARKRDLLKMIDEGSTVELRIDGPTGIKRIKITK